MATKTKIRARIVAVASALALVFTIIPSAVAAADELTGSGASGKPAATIASEISTTLAANLSSSATSATLTDGTGFASGDRALIGNEVVELTTVSSNTVSAMSRAASSTTAAAHRAGSTIRDLSQVVQLVFESGDHSIVSGDKIVITVPADFSNFANLAAGDISATTESTGSLSATETFDSTARTITLTADGDFSDANEAVTITLGGTNKLQMPAAPGNFAFHIAVKNSSDEVLETGYALLGWANSVVVRATVAEALVLTIDDTSIDLDVDPSVDDGEDYSQKTILTVQTNANSGYKIQAKLAGSENSNLAQLDGTDAGNTSAIAGGDAESTENRFGYIAYNSEISKTKTELKSEGAVATFAAETAANLDLYDGTSDGVGFSGPTNSQLHTVYYAFNVDYLTPAGTYEGTITYVALPTF